MAKIITKFIEYIAVLSGFLFLLTSCAHVPESQPLNLSWPQRQPALMALTSWQFRGHVIFKMPKNKLSANIFWQQQSPQAYHVMLFGPLGFSAVELNGQADQVNLKDSHGRVYHSSNPESLMMEQLGWSLPVSSLYYWVRGLPAPGAITDVQYDAFHRIALLKQQGWEMHFISYTRVQWMELPTEIIFEKESFFMRLTVEDDSWQIGFAKEKS